MKCIKTKLKCVLNATYICMKYPKTTMLIAMYQKPPHLDFGCPQAKLKDQIWRLNKRSIDYSFQFKNN